MQALKIPSPLRDMPVSGPPALALSAPDTGRAWRDEPPAPVRTPPAWRWLYLPASFWIVLVIKDGELDMAERMGIALVLVAFCALVAAAFYIWRKATRPAIPATTFILTFLLAAGILADQQSQEEREAGALQEAAGRFATATEPHQAIPTDVEARIAWASRWALSDLVHHYEKLQSDRDIDPDEFPAGWLTARYAADAGDYPRVRSYFAAYRDYLAVADSSTQAVFTERYRDRLMETGYTVQQAELMAASIPAEAAEAMRSRREDFQLSTRLADSALVLHAYLVRTDARAHYDGGKGVARFERNDERRRGSELMHAVTRLVSEQETLRAGNHALWQQRLTEAGRSPW